MINNHPDVAESCVIGVHDEDAGGEEEVKACIVSIDKALDYTSILDWCVTRMPRYAVPRYIEYVHELDKTPTGKLRKQALRDAGITADTCGFSLAHERQLLPLPGHSLSNLYDAMYRNEFKHRVPSNSSTLVLISRGSLLMAKN